MATNEDRRRRNIVDRLHRVLPPEQLVNIMSRWMTVDTLEAMVAGLEDKKGE